MKNNLINISLFLSCLVVSSIFQELKSETNMEDFPVFDDIDSSENNSSYVESIISSIVDDEDFPVFDYEIDFEMNNVDDVKTEDIIDNPEYDKKLYFSIAGGIAYPSDVKGDTNLGGTNYDGKFITDNTALYSAGLGRKFNDYRLELNYSALNVQADSVSIYSQGVEVNSSISPKLNLDLKNVMLYGFKDFVGSSRFTPYLGIGAGKSYIFAEDQITTVNGTSYSILGSNEDVFTYAFKVGTSYEISEKSILFSELIYQNLSSLTVDKGTPINYDSNDFYGITTGLRFYF